MRLIYLSEVIQKLINSGLVSSKEISPCDDLEISEMEVVLRHDFPLAYREFLLIMGKGAGLFLRGSDAFYEHLLLIQKEANDLLEENLVSETYPNDAFVFLLHQGYSFAFFRFKDGSNPPVYSYTEGDKSIKLISESFSTYLLSEIDVMLEIQRSTKINYKKWV